MLRVYVPRPKSPARRISIATRIAPAPLVERETRGEFGDFGAHALFALCVAQMLQDFGDPLRDRLHLGLAHAARGDGGSAHANSAGHHRWRRIEWDRIFVHGDSRAIERRLRVLALDAARMEVDEK